MDGDPMLRKLLYAGLMLGVVSELEDRKTDLTTITQGCQVFLGTT
jgi:hypothetical protein